MDASWIVSASPARGLVYGIDEAVPAIRLFADYDVSAGDYYDVSEWMSSPSTVAGPAAQFASFADSTEYSGDFSFSSFNTPLNASLEDHERWSNSPSPSAQSTAISSSPSQDSPQAIQPESTDFDTRQDSDLRNLESSASPRPRPAPRYAPSDGFARHKSDIKELYIKRNYNLKDAMRLIKQRYGFSATEKMYKSQLKKWGLTKYQRRGGSSETSSSSSRGNPSCRRHPAQQEMHREDKVTELLSTAFRAFDSLLKWYAGQDLEWSQRSRFEPGCLQYGLGTQIATAVNLMHEDGPWWSDSGGEHLRSSFRTADSLLSDLDLRGGIDLILWAPGELLALGSNKAIDILGRYLHYLEDYSRQSGKISSSHPIWHLIVALRQLAGLGNHELRSFVVRGTEVLTNFTSCRVKSGDIDRTHVDALSFSLFLKLRMDKRNCKDLCKEYDWAAQKLVRTRKELIEHAKREEQPDDTVLQLQADLLVFQDNVDTIIEFDAVDFVRQSVALMDMLSNKYGRGSFARGAVGWSRRHSSIYAARVTELARHFFLTGQARRAIDLLPDIMVIPRLDLKIFIHAYISLFLFIIDQLQKPEFGRYRQANELSFLLHRHQGSVLDADVADDFQTLAIDQQPAGFYPISA